MGCLINCSFEIKRSPSSSSGSLIDTGLKWALLLGLCTATVFIGGIGALQNECLGDDLNTNGLDGIWGFSPLALSCKKVFRCESAGALRAPLRLCKTPRMLTRPPGFQNLFPHAWLQITGSSLPFSL